MKEEIIQNGPGDKLDGSLFRKNTVYLKSATGKTLHEGINPESEIISNLSQAINIFV